MSDCNHQDTVDQVKDAVETKLAESATVPAGPRLYAAPNFGPLLANLDGILQKYVPAIGPLAPPQVAALAALVAEAVHLANGAFNHPPAA